jgi:DNA repair protein RadA/Sms
MSKKKTSFICKSCGHTEPKWLGRCPACGEWNTFSESAADTGGGGAKAGAAAISMPLSAVTPDDGVRIDSGMEEMNRVLGGGLMKGSSVLVGGEPGIGKSTLMMQIAASKAVSGRVLYISGEESPGQIRSRADRLGIMAENLEILSSSELETIEKTLERIKPVIVIVDSIQTLTSREVGAVPGTVNQIKYCCHDIVSWSRERGTAVLLVAHVTKEGSIAGPKVIEHMVDAVLLFESASSEVRILRAGKNRYGSVDEIGLFFMTERGLNQVKNPSSYFMVQREGPVPAGIAVAPVYEGSRILLVELQALVVPAKGGFSRIFSDRVDAGRVSRIAAVLEKHAGVKFSDHDLYINVAGGIRLKEVGIELPLAMALYSARTDIPLPDHTALAAELSLAGEVRPIPHLRRRIKAAGEMGFANVVGPAGVLEEEPPEEKWTRVRTVKESISALFGKTLPREKG